MDELNKFSFDRLIKENFLMTIIHSKINDLLDGQVLVDIHHIQDIVILGYDTIKHRNIYHDQVPTILKMLVIHLLTSYELDGKMHSKLDLVIDKSIELLFYKPNKHHHCKCCLYF